MRGRDKLTRTHAHARTHPHADAYARTRTHAHARTRARAQAINKSLSALGNVIESLMKKASHIPFRDSKLTHLLSDSLGGDSKCLMFVQVAPTSCDVSETLCSLNFAARARSVELGQAKRHSSLSGPGTAAAQRRPSTAGVTRK
jgi:kinesin family protein C2/C3